MLLASPGNARPVGYCLGIGRARVAAHLSEPRTAPAPLLDQRPLAPKVEADFDLIVTGAFLPALTQGHHKLS